MEYRTAQTYFVDKKVHKETEREILQDWSLSSKKDIVQCNLSENDYETVRTATSGRRKKKNKKHWTLKKDITMNLKIGRKWPVWNKCNLLCSSSFWHKRTSSVPLDSAWLLQFEPQSGSPRKVSQSECTVIYVSK